VLNTLFLQPPSFDGFDGRAGNAHFVPYPAWSRGVIKADPSGADAGGAWGSPEKASAAAAITPEISQAPMTSRSATRLSVFAWYPSFVSAIVRSHRPRTGWFCPDAQMSLGYFRISGHLT
jgi:hypothetical protein